MEREWVRNSSLCVPRSLERLERNESGSSVQDSLMLLQTIRRFTYLYPKIDQRPLQRFLRSSSRKMPLSFSFRECVMLSMEKKPVGRLSLVGSFNRYPIRKKASRGNVMLQQTDLILLLFSRIIIQFSRRHFYYARIKYLASLNVIEYRMMEV